MMINKINILILLLLLYGVACFAGGTKAPKMPYYKATLERKQLYRLEAFKKDLKDNPEKTIKELDAIIKSGIKLNLFHSISSAYLLMGEAYKELQQPQLALHFLHLAKENYEKTESLLIPKGDSIAAFPVSYYKDLGEVYVQLGDFTKANRQFDIYLQNTNNITKQKEVRYQLGENYYALEKFEQAIALYKRLLLEEKQIQNDLAVRTCYSRLAACYISIGKTSEGLAYYKKSITGILEKEKEGGYLTNSLESKEIVTKALRKTNRYQEELFVRNEALAIIDDGLEHLRLAQTYLKANNFSKAETSLDQFFSKPSYDILDKDEIVVIKKIAEKLNAQNRSKKAFLYLKLHQQFTDSIDDKLLKIKTRSARLGTSGYQNIIQLEVLQKDKEISENTISHLMRESDLKEDILSSQKTIIYLLCVLLLLGVIALFYIQRVSKQRRIANQQLALRSLRSQMNPHFIFNALNSVNSFISLSDERSANRFLSEFSTLMRTVMENSEFDFIPLTKELEIIKIYVELEYFRFKDKFSYQLNIDPILEDEEFLLPPMLIQPYIENAIWHGLRYKEDKGELVVSFKKEKDKLSVSIQDDGIGRAKSEEIKTKNQKKNKSTALRNIKERIRLLKSLHGLDIVVDTQNLNPDGSGTIVSILIPQSKNE